jgi:hypothetical protein
MFVKSTLAKGAALTAFAGIAIGGLAVAGALPGVAPASPPVSTPAPNSHAGDHPDIGADNGAVASSLKGDNAHVPDTTAPADESASTETADAGSRADGLATAQGNVTNPTASSVLDQVASGTPGPGFGQDVAAAAGAPAGPPVSVPPVPVSTPPQADTGLSHRP